MNKYTAIFKSGKEITFWGEEYRDRLDVYNYICRNRMGLLYGELVEIRMSVLPR